MLAGAGMSACNGHVLAYYKHKIQNLRNEAACKAQAMIAAAPQVWIERFDNASVRYRGYGRVQPCHD